MLMWSLKADGCHFPTEELGAYQTGLYLTALILRAYSSKYFQ